jgi:hypothetical protein
MSIQRPRHQSEAITISSDKYNRIDGDDDVFTKSDRETFVGLYVDCSVAPTDEKVKKKKDGQDVEVKARRVTLHVVSIHQEQSGDETAFEAVLDHPVYLEMDDNESFVSLKHEPNPFHYAKKHRGQLHGWQVLETTPHDIITYARVRFDRKGDDDDIQGAHLRVSINYIVERVE